MTNESESPKRGLGLPALVFATLAFLFVAPIGFVTLPLTALILRTDSWHERYAGKAFLTFGLSVWWLASVGSPPDQMVKSWAVMSAVLFGVVAHRQATLLSRALTATLGGTAGTLVLAMAMRLSWDELTWWVRQELTTAMQWWAPLIYSSGSRGSPQALADMDATGQMMTEFIPQIFAGIVAIQMLLGMALAALLYHRLLAIPTGSQPGRFRDFRFSEHLGWLVAVPLAILLFLGGGKAHAVAANVLVVGLGLYLWRGVAVFFNVFGAIKIPRPLLAVLVVLAIFLLPVTIPIAVIVGILDTGLDFRARWSSPQARD